MQNLFLCLRTQKCNNLGGTRGKNSSHYPAVLLELEHTLYNKKKRLFKLKLNRRWIKNMVLTCKELINILHLSSCDTLDCLINDIAVTRVSIAPAYSPKRN